MPTVYCGNCQTGKDYPHPETRVPPEGWWWIEGPEGTAYLCSLECMLELAFKLREQRPKLSKSRQS